LKTPASGPFRRAGQLYEKDKEWVHTEIWFAWDGTLSSYMYIQCLSWNSPLEYYRRGKTRYEKGQDRQ